MEKLLSILVVSFVFSIGFVFGEQFGFWRYVENSLKKECPDCRGNKFMVKANGNKVKCSYCDGEGKVW